MPTETIDAIQPRNRIRSHLAEAARADAGSAAGWGTAVLRITVGAIFAAHGAQKLFGFGLDGVAGFMAGQGIPFPMLSAVLATGAELLGGAALVVGLFTRLAAIPLAFTMLVAMLAVHLPGGFFLPAGVEYTLALLGASVALALLGSGRASLDGLLAARKDGDVG